MEYGQYMQILRDAKAPQELIDSVIDLSYLKTNLKDLTKERDKLKKRVEELQHIESDKLEIQRIQHLKRERCYSCSEDTILSDEQKGVWVCGTCHRYGYLKNTPQFFNNNRVEVDNAEKKLSKELMDHNDFLRLRSSEMLIEMNGIWEKYAHLVRHTEFIKEGYEKRIRGLEEKLRDIEKAVE